MTDTLSLLQLSFFTFTFISDPSFQIQKSKLVFAAEKKLILDGQFIIVNDREHSSIKWSTLSQAGYDKDLTDAPLVSDDGELFMAHKVMFTS